MTSYIEKVLVTPELAQEILGTMSTNRHLVQQNVKELVSKINQGKWHVDSAPPIKIDWDNKLIDGQHRLKACIESGVSLEMFIQRECDPSSQQYIDRGMRRNLGQDLTMRGYKYATTIAGMIGPVAEFRDTEKISDQVKQPDYDEAKAWLEKYPYISDIAFDAHKIYGNGRKLTTRPLTPTQCAILWHLFHLASSYDDAKNFLSIIMLGTTDIEGAPYRLRERLLSETSNTKARIKSSVVYHLSIKAWNAWLRDENIKQLKQDMKFPAIVKKSGGILTANDF